ncbi:MAG: sigma-54 dependent transcriptional regulator [Phycisphaerae bacterium]|jgi:two-component system response regulator HydG
MADKYAILIVDVDADYADALVQSLSKGDTNASAVYNAAEAVEMLEQRFFNLVITDLNLNDNSINGIDILKAAKQSSQDCQVILTAASATIESCKEAIRLGAYDYIEKPVEISQLRQIAERALKKKESVVVKSFGRGIFRFPGVMGKSPAMQTVFSVLSRVSPTNLTVLIEGESGTGKELLAQAIHSNSLRRNNAFRPLNCAGLTESLLESELFGHAKGAFTGATEARKGLFEIADKGTLFLDEIGDMPLVMQAKLLRVLEDGIVVPVGSNKSTVVDVRVISATNHNLTALVEQGKFRQDLYFRIKGVSITVPPLRSRIEDIAELADFFLADACRELGIPPKTISDNALMILQGYSWPGNVRQLRTAIRTMAVMSDAEKLDVRDIPQEIHHLRQLAGNVAVSAAGNLSGVALNELEKQAIIDTLNSVQNNREQAAKLLGIGERTLYRKIKEYNIQ